MNRLLLIGIMWPCVYVNCQTLIDLRTQGRDVDFSSQAFTRPVKVGTSLPVTCNVGDLYFRSDVTAGGNLYGCAGQNTWAQMTSSAGVGGTTYSAGMGVQLNGDAFSADFSVLAGLGVSNIWSSSNDFSRGQLRTQVGVGVPSTLACADSTHIGKLYVRGDAAATQASLYVCDQTGPGVYAWELVQSASGGGGSTTAKHPIPMILGTCNSSGNYLPASVTYGGSGWNPLCYSTTNLGYLPWNLSGNLGDNLTFWTTVSSNLIAVDVTATGLLHVANGGTSTWTARVVCPSVGSAIGSMAWNTGVAADATAGAATDAQYTWTMLNVPIDGCIANGLMGINIVRSGSYGNGSQVQLTSMQINETRTLP